MTPEAALVLENFTLETRLERRYGDQVPPAVFRRILQTNYFQIKGYEDSKMRVSREHRGRSARRSRHAML